MSDDKNAANQWRGLALQFDNHRMQALYHLKALLQYPTEHAEAARTFLASPPEYPKSHDIILYCPKCHTQHIDKPETEGEYSKKLFESSWWELGGDKPERWINPPHRSHLCANPECRHIWRPADFPTNGVASIQTKGKDDSP